MRSCLLACMRARMCLSVCVTKKVYCNNHNTFTYKQPYYEIFNFIPGTYMDNFINIILLICIDNLRIH